MRGVFFKYLMAVFLMFSAAPSWAGGSESEAEGFVPIRDADVLIQECWEISKDDIASQNSARWRRGYLERSLCLMEHIIDNASMLIDFKYMSRVKIEEHIENMRVAYGKFYWSLYNENKGCNPSCGTFNHFLHNERTAHAFELILRDIIKQRKHYGF